MSMNAGLVESFW